MIKKTILALLLICMCIAAWVGCTYYEKIWKQNVFLNKDKDYIYIKTGSTLNELADMLSESKIIKNKESFLWLCEKKKFDDSNLKPGKYLLKTDGAIMILLIIYD